MWEPLTLLLQPLDLRLHGQNRSVRSCHSNRDPPLPREALGAETEADEEGVAHRERGEHGREILMRTF